ncbi:MAG: hypothetical protein HY921_04395 [Elusimicrobia bacterium]|nr:hypothetical protein [Elusimicrobiota bacterium]
MKYQLIFLAAALSALPLRAQTWPFNDIEIEKATEAGQGARKTVIAPPKILKARYNAQTSGPEQYKCLSLQTEGMGAVGQQAEKLSIELRLSDPKDPEKNPRFRLRVCRMSPSGACPISNPSGQPVNVGNDTDEGALMNCLDRLAPDAYTMLLGHLAPSAGGKVKAELMQNLNRAYQPLTPQAN